ncbi:hypothetical protein TNCV_5034731 [Trichonephila clavipes]|nr:hypothetical protein TNCV_5034731 [Trichonephila clavipes]
MELDLFTARSACLAFQVPFCVLPWPCQLFPSGCLDASSTPAFHRLTHSPCTAIFVFTCMLYSSPILCPMSLIFPEVPCGFGYLPLHSCLVDHRVFLPRSDTQ